MEPDYFTSHSKHFGINTTGSAESSSQTTSSDGWSSSDFHDNYDDEGPTIAIVCSTIGYIFGGFCDTAWSGDECHKTSPKAFFFTLKCYSGLPPTKMQLRVGKDC
eukprot:15364857-Ditylum_brightwellii.AAC.7